MRFLHRLDGLREEAQWVETSATELARASFLDGRETFWSAAAVSPFDLRTRPEGGPVRIIFHVGFCGSTLLTRMLEREAGLLALREPQALTDLASQQAQLVAAHGQERLVDLLAFALAHLAAGDDGRAVVIKPSNWVNALIPLVAEHKLARHAVCMTMDRWAYLRAVFRGGRERIAFALRHVQLLAASDPVLAEHLRAAISRDRDPLDQAARATVLLHRAQEDLFATLAPQESWLDFETLTRRPDAALALARETLGLAPDGREGAELPGEDAKDPSRAFSADTRQDQDALVDRHHAARFEAALGWLESVR
ncbi:hypothetical protein [Alteriqipengyuania sp. 357]